MDLISEVVVQMREIADNLERHYYKQPESTETKGRTEGYPSENLIVVEDADGLYLAKNSSFTLSGSQRLVHELFLIIEYDAIKIQRSHTITVDRDYLNDKRFEALKVVEELEDMLLKTYKKSITADFKHTITRIRTTW